MPPTLRGTISSDSVKIIAALKLVQARFEQHVQSLTLREGRGLSVRQSNKQFRTLTMKQPCKGKGHPLAPQAIKRVFLSLVIILLEPSEGARES